MTKAETCPDQRFTPFPTLINVLSHPYQNHPTHLLETRLHEERFGSERLLRNLPCSQGDRALASSSRSPDRARTPLWKPPLLPPCLSKASLMGFRIAMASTDIPRSVIHFPKSYGVRSVGPLRVGMTNTTWLIATG